MPVVTQLAVTVENKPGSLARICSVLGSAGVNISAIYAPEAKEKGRVRLLVDNATRAKNALEQAKLRFSEEEVLALYVENKPGAFAALADKLAQAKINIKYAYATTAEGYARAVVILAVPNVTKALAALGG